MEGLEHTEVNPLGPPNCLEQEPGTEKEGLRAGVVQLEVGREGFAALGN